MHLSKKYLMILVVMYYTMHSMVKRTLSLFQSSLSFVRFTGFNCSLFAYGQTGSGKSYSMIGYGVNRYEHDVLSSKESDLFYLVELFPLYAMNYSIKYKIQKDH